MKDVSNYRKSYEKSELLESHVAEDPINQFNEWFYEAENSGGVDEVNAMTVSTIGLDGTPKSRVVLLKKFTYEGFIFYTNYNSEKGQSIEHNPNVCLSFFWPAMERQVIIQGKAEKVPESISDGYFESRPKGSQLGALASQQSSVVPSRAYLEKEMKSLEKEYSHKEVQRPKSWGGYLVKPLAVEFWQGRPNRLHDRIKYTQLDDFSWKIERLSP